MARSVEAIETLVTGLVNLLNKDLYLGALTDANITADVCFDCELWLNGYSDNNVVVIPPIKTTLVNRLTTFENDLTTFLADADIDDYGFKTQIERLLTIIKDLKNKINSIQCVETCSDIGLIAQLLGTLVVTLSQLISILEIFNGLLAYLNACGCVGSQLFNLLMGKFINSITELQVLLQDWNNIVMTFFHYSSISTKSYVASYMPRQPIPVPQPQGPMNHACVPCPPRQPCNCPPQNNCTPYPY